MTKISPLLSQSILISQIIENRIVQGLVENTVILKKTADFVGVRKKQ